MKIGFIGCGNMGSAMIGGILKNGVFEKNEIIVSNLTEEGSRRSQEKLGVVTTLDNCEVVKNANIVILAVKPQFYEEVIGEIKNFLTPQHMIVGIAPGKTLAWLEEKCEQPLKVVRLMPNTPAQVGAGMTGACVNDRVTEEDLDQILAITNSFGRTEAQAVLGSAKLLLETGMHPGELKDMVCSPAGTTIEGVRILEKNGFRSAVFEALQGAADKGKKM